MVHYICFIILSGNYLQEMFVIIATLLLGCSAQSYVVSTFESAIQSYNESMYETFVRMFKPKEGIDCTGLVAEDVLIMLYNNAALFSNEKTKNKIMKRDDAKKVLQSSLSVDYIDDRPIKISFSTWPQIDAFEYDLFNGNGSAYELIQALRMMSNKKSLSKTVIWKYEKVIFTKTFSEQLEKLAIPYPYDWHLFIGLNKDRDYMFVGQMGGRFTVPKDVLCVDRVVS